MKLIKLNTDHYIIVDENGKQIGWKLDTAYVKELIGEVDVENKAEEKYPKSEFWVGSNPSRLYDENAKERRCFIEGYNQALEDNKEKKWTDDDLRKAIFLYAAWITGGSPSLRIAETAGQRIEQIIKSLQPKTEWEVEFVDGKLKLKLFH